MGDYLEILIDKIAIGIGIGIAASQKAGVFLHLSVEDLIEHGGL